MECKNCRYFEPVTSTCLKTEHCACGNDIKGAMGKHAKPEYNQAIADFQWDLPTQTTQQDVLNDKRFKIING